VIHKVTLRIVLLLILVCGWIGLLADVETAFLNDRGRNYDVKKMRCDQSGENVKYLTQLCDKYGIQMEITAANTPQMNGVVERAFAVTKERAMAMLFNANFTKKTREYLWAEATNTATYVSNILPISSNDGNTSSEEVFYGEDPK